MIRRIRPDDLMPLLALCAELHERAVHYSELPWHRPTVSRMFQHAISAAPTSCCFVAEHDDKVTGFLLGVAQEYWWAEPGKGPRVASDLLFYSKRHGDGPQLVDAFLEWAAGVPRVRRVECGVSSGIRPERVARMYRDIGFIDNGTMHIIEVVPVSAKAAGEAQ